MSELKACPCGKTPDRLSITESATSKWAFVSGDCCGDWLVEFRTNYHDLASSEMYELAEKAWNEMPRTDEARIRREAQRSWRRVWRDQRNDKQSPSEEDMETPLASTRLIAEERAIAKWLGWKNSKGPSCYSLDNPKPYSTEIALWHDGLLQKIEEEGLDGRFAMSFGEHVLRLVNHIRVITILLATPAQLTAALVATIKDTDAS